MPANSTTPDRQSDQILIIGNYRQTLTAIRSLAAEGYQLVLGVDGDAAGSEHSRHTREVWPHPPITANKITFASALIELLTQRKDIAFLFPVGEDEMIAIIGIRQRLPAHVKILMPAAKTVQTCLDKSAMLQVVDHLHIPQARHATVSSLNELHTAADRIGYPLVIKPTDSSFKLLGGKAVICPHAAALHTLLSSWPVGERRLIVQRHAGGVRHNVYFFATNGKLIQASQVRIFRTDQPDDTGLAVSGVTVALDPKLEKHCRTLLRHLDYTGMGCVQFQVDEENDTLSFLELNPRLGANFAIAYKAGLNLPKMAIELAEGRLDTTAPEYNKPCKVGLHYAWTHGELLALKNAIANEGVSLKAFLSRLLLVGRTFVTSSVHVTWSWKDPLPTLYLYKELLHIPLKRIWPFTASAENKKNS